MEMWSWNWEALCKAMLYKFGCPVYLTANVPIEEFSPSPAFPALQYLESVDEGGVASQAGLRVGDFLIEVNGENVVKAGHRQVVQMIRQGGDHLDLKVVSVDHRPSSTNEDFHTDPLEQRMEQPYSDHDGAVGGEGLQPHSRQGPSDFYASFESQAFPEMSSSGLRAMPRQRSTGIYGEEERLIPSPCFRFTRSASVPNAADLLSTAPSSPPSSASHHCTSHPTPSPPPPPKIPPPPPPKTRVASTQAGLDGAREGRTQGLLRAMTVSELSRVDFGAPLSPSHRTTKTRSMILLFDSLDGGDGEVGDTAAAAAAVAGLATPLLTRQGARRRTGKAPLTPYATVGHGGSLIYTQAQHKGPLVKQGHVDSSPDRSRIVPTIIIKEPSTSSSGKSSQGSSMEFEGVGGIACEMESLSPHESLGAPLASALAQAAQNRRLQQRRRSANFLSVDTVDGNAHTSSRRLRLQHSKSIDESLFPDDSPVFLSAPPPVNSLTSSPAAISSTSKFTFHDKADMVIVASAPDNGNAREGEGEEQQTQKPDWQPLFIETTEGNDGQGVSHADGPRGLQKFIAIQRDELATDKGQVSEENRDVGFVMRQVENGEAASRGQIETADPSHCIESRSLLQPPLSIPKPPPSDGEPALPLSDGEEDFVFTDPLPPPIEVEQQTTAVPSPAESPASLILDEGHKSVCKDGLRAEPNKKLLALSAEVSLDSGVEEMDRSVGSDNQLETTGTVSTVSSTSTLSSEGGEIPDSCTLPPIPSTLASVATVVEGTTFSAERPPVPPKPKSKAVMSHVEMCRELLVKRNSEGALFPRPTALSPCISDNLQERSGETRVSAKLGSGSGTEQGASCAGKSHANDAGASIISELSARLQQLSNRRAASVTTSVKTSETTSTFVETSPSLRLPDGTINTTCHKPAKSPGKHSLCRSSTVGPSSSSTNTSLPQLPNLHPGSLTSAASVPNIAAVASVGQDVRFSPVSPRFSRGYGTVPPLAVSSASQCRGAAFIPRSSAGIFGGLSTSVRPSSPALIHSSTFSFTTSPASHDDEFSLYSDTGDYSNLVNSYNECYSINNPSTTTPSTPISPSPSLSRSTFSFPSLPSTTQPPLASGQVPERRLTLRPLRSRSVSPAPGRLLSRAPIRPISPCPTRRPPPSPDLHSPSSPLSWPPIPSDKPFTRKPLASWSKFDVADWLDSLNMGDHRCAFLENEIDGSHLPALQKEELLELGVTRVGHRMNIERALRLLLER
uniref:SH3 and multiple ankyrin repeat domains protein 2 n=1 Tax=Eptatretus burgeri TaxID=7764 RepID=A0A8C4NCB5_EPTBU